MQYLGVVDWTTVDKNNHKIGGVKPLFEQKNGSWVAVDTARFEPAGMVFWYGTQSDRGTLVYFSVVESSMQDGYKYNLQTWTPAVEVLILNEFPSFERLRLALRQGLTVNGYLPLKAHIWVNEEKVVGPFSFGRRPDGSCSFEAPQIHKIPVYAAGFEHIWKFKVDGTEHAVVRNDKHLAVSSYVDWDTDRNVLKRAIEWIVKNEGVEIGEVTNLREFIDAAYTKLKPGEDNAELKLEYYRLTRARNLCKNVDAIIQLSEEVAGELKESPSVRRELDAIREKVESDTRREFEAGLQGERDKFRADLQRERTELEAELKKEREDLQQLGLEKEALEQEVEQARLAVGQVRGEIENRTKELENEIDNRIRLAIEKPVALLAESAVISAVLPHFRTTGDHGPPVKAAAKLPSWKPGENSISSFTELEKRLRKNLKRYGISTAAGKRIHAAVAGNILPILSGFNGGFAAQAYADSVCGGRLFRLGVSPRFLEFSDLLETACVEPPDLSGRLLLSTLIEAARSLSGNAVLVLEGINRAPTENYLLTLLEATRRGNWCFNLLVIATLVDGPTTLPLSRDVWSRSVLIETGDRFSFDDAIVEQPKVEADEGLFDSAESNELDADEFFEDFPEFGDRRELAARFVQFLAQFDDVAEDEEKEAVVENILFPLIASVDSEDERGELVKRIGGDTVYDQDLSDLLKRIEKVRSLIS